MSCDVTTFWRKCARTLVECAKLLYFSRADLASGKEACLQRAAPNRPRSTFRANRCLNRPLAVDHHKRHALVEVAGCQMANATGTEGTSSQVQKRAEVLVHVVGSQIPSKIVKIDAAVLEKGSSGPSQHGYQHFGDEVRPICVHGALQEQNVRQRELWRILAATL